MSVRTGKKNPFMEADLRRTGFQKVKGKANEKGGLDINLNGAKEAKNDALKNAGYNKNGQVTEKVVIEMENEENSIKTSDHDETIKISQSITANKFEIITSVSSENSITSKVMKRETHSLEFLIDVPTPLINVYSRQILNP